MSGSVHQLRPNSWQVRVSSGRNPESGKYRYVHRTVTGNKRDVAVAVPLVSIGHQVVQGDEAPNVRDRHHDVAAGPAQLTYHPAVLMGALDPGLTEEGLEAVVVTRGDEPLNLEPAPTFHHPDHCGLQVVIADPPRHPGSGGPEVTVVEDLVFIASSSTRGVICQENPHWSLHLQQALTSPPLSTIAFQDRSGSS